MLVFVRMLAVDTRCSSGRGALGVLGRFVAGGSAPPFRSLPTLTGGRGTAFLSPSIIPHFH
eukprot:91693-Prorocentrum_lima.AAC.1